MTLASATGASSSVKRLSIAAANKKSAAAKIVKTRTKPTDNAPAGIARIFVLGFRASYSLSARRLKAMAVDRAPTIARVIQRICIAVGRPWAASTAPRKAKGSANSVCSILIISSVGPMFFRIIKGPREFLFFSLSLWERVGERVVGLRPPHPTIIQRERELFKY